MGLSDGRKSFPIGLAVLIQYRSVTDTQPPSQSTTQPPSHVAVAITLNAQASSLKSTQNPNRTEPLSSKNPNRTRVQNFLCSFPSLITTTIRLRFDCDYTFFCRFLDFCIYFRLFLVCHLHCIVWIEINYTDIRHPFGNLRPLDDVRYDRATALRPKYINK